MEHKNFEKPDVVLDVASDDMHTAIEVQQTALPDTGFTEFLTVEQRLSRIIKIGSIATPRIWD